MINYRITLLWLIVIVLAIAAASCKKEDNTDPHKIQIGVWHTANSSLQIPIKNLEGKGEFYNVLEYADFKGRFLKITCKNPDIEFMYRVQSVYFNTMVLVGEDGTVYNMYL